MNPGNAARHSAAPEPRLQLVGPGWTVTLVRSMNVPGAWALPGRRIATRDMLDTMARTKRFVVREVTGV